MTATGNPQNVLRTYFQATAQEITTGLTWYVNEGDHAWERAHNLLDRNKIGRMHRNHIYARPRDKVMGIVAALSPNKSWQDNLRLMEQFLRVGDAGTYKTQVRKAQRIMVGEPILDVLRGPKERAFYQCFTQPETDAVVVDGHTYSVWLGRYVSTSKAKVRPRGYDLATTDIRKTARIMNIRPYQMQAIVWVTHRRMHGSNGHTQDVKARS